MAANYLLQEDGASKLILEDGSGDLILESSTPATDVPFGAWAQQGPTLRRQPFRMVMSGNIPGRVP